MTREAKVKRKKKRSTAAQIFYDARYRFGEYALRGFVSCLPRLPLSLTLGYTRLMAHVTYTALWRYRQRMEQNIALVFPDFSPEERKELVKAAWSSFARGVLDTTLATSWSREQIVRMVELRGEEHLRKALDQKKGVLALSAHLGSFTMIGARLAASGYPFSVVVKPPGDQNFARLIDTYRSRIGIHTISAKPRREAVRGILRALRDNRIVLVLADEFKSGDIMVDFLGLRAPAPRGPATLALRTGAITLPMFATRQKDDSLLLAIGAAIAPVQRGDLEQSVIATTMVYTRHIEAAIRQYPGQWNWLGLPRRDRSGKSREEIARRRALRRERRKARRAASSSSSA